MLKQNGVNKIGRALTNFLAEKRSEEKKKIVGYHFNILKYSVANKLRIIFVVFYRLLLLLLLLFALPYSLMLPPLLLLLFVYSCCTVACAAMLFRFVCVLFRFIFHFFV